MHLDEEQVHRLVDGELATAVATSCREHLARCAECRGRVDEAEGEAAEVNALLRALDHPPPRLDAHAVAASARAAAAGGGARDFGRPAGGGGRDFARLRWAAGIVLALGLAGGAAYTLPGSPVRAWVQAAVERIGGRPKPAPPPEAAPDRDPNVAGIAVAPGRALVILFTSPQPAGRAHVSLTDGAEVVVRAPVGAAKFTSDRERLVIDNRGSSAAFQVEIPRSAPRVEIRVDARQVLFKEGARVTAAVPADAAGSYVLPLTDPGP